MVKVVICKGDAYNATLKALRLANFKKFVKKKEKIVIKPNLVLPIHSSKGITTDVNVVKAILDCLPNREKVVIADGSNRVNESFELNGYTCLAREYNIKLVDLNEDEMISVTLNNPLVLKEIKIAKTVLESDFLISVGKLKTHSIAKISGSIKNMMGVCPKDQRLKIHAFLPYSLLDLLSVVFPDFGVIDGVVANEIDENIPNPVKMGIVLASENLVALDIVASEVMGIKATNVPYVWKALKRNFGVSDINQIEISGEKINDVKKLFDTGGLNLRSYTQKIFVGVFMKLKFFDLTYPYLEKLCKRKFFSKFIRLFL